MLERTTVDRGGKDGEDDDGGAGHYCIQHSIPISLDEINNKIIRRLFPILYELEGDGP